MAGRKTAREPAGRRVWYSAAMSLDGYIARKDGSFDWIPEEPAIDWGAFMKRFDTVLLGRKTWEITASGTGGASAPKMKTLVFSRTLAASDHPDLEIVASDAAGRVEQLKKEPGRDIWLMGGGMLFRDLLRAGQVDVIEVGLVPGLLGEGIPLVAPSAGETRLKLTARQEYPSGIVLLAYDVLNQQAT